MNCLLYLTNSQSRQHFRANVFRSKPLIAQPSLNLPFPSSSQSSQQQLHASNCFGQPPWESLLNSLSCLTYDSSAVPAHTGLETHPKSDLFSPFTVITLDQPHCCLSSGSWQSFSMTFQSFSLLTSLFYFHNLIHTLHNNVFKTCLKKSI